VVENGLNAGERVVTAGQYKVQQGSVVSSAVASSDGSPAKAP